MCSTSIRAGVFSNHLEHVTQVHRELDVGGIMINYVPGFRVDSMPYGDVKDSDPGRSGSARPQKEMTGPRMPVC